MTVSASSVCDRGRLLVVEDPVREVLNLIPAPKQVVSTDLFVRLGYPWEWAARLDSRTQQIPTDTPGTEDLLDREARCLHTHGI